jgi:sulfur-carrier protein
LVAQPPARRLGILPRSTRTSEQYLYTSDGKLHTSVNVYKGDEDILHFDGPDTEVSDGDELSIIPSIAGGCAEG